MVAVTAFTIGFTTCQFASVQYIALGTQSCIYRTLLMVGCVVLGRLVMKERITVPKVGEWWSVGLVVQGAVPTLF